MNALIDDLVTANHILYHQGSLTVMAMSASAIPGMPNIF